MCSQKLIVIINQTTEEVATLDQEIASVDDLVTLLFALIPSEKMEGSIPKIHRAFFRTMKQFPGILDYLLFDTNGHMPVSDRLDEIIRRFKLSGLITFTYTLCPKMTMRQGIKDKVRKADEASVRQRVPQLDEMVEFLSQQLVTAS